MHNNLRDTWQPHWSELQLPVIYLLIDNVGVSMVHTIIQVIDAISDQGQTAGPH